MSFIARLENLSKYYFMGNQEVPALREIDLVIEKGEFLAIMGPSGSGKSTLLNVLGCLDKPTSGSYFLGGEDISKLSDDELSAIRSMRLGFVFQSYNLIPQLTVIVNIEVPLYYQGKSETDSARRAEELARTVGLGDRLSHRPMELSGVQQQRVAIARSLSNDPLIILADEPTGNLDTKTGIEIMALFKELNEKDGITIVMVTHEREIGEYADRIINIRDGLVGEVEVL